MRDDKTITIVTNRNIDQKIAKLVPSAVDTPRGDTIYLPNLLPRVSVVPSSFLSSSDPIPYNISVI